MNRKSILIGLFFLVLFLLAVVSHGQRGNWSTPNLIPFGVISPDGRKSVFTMSSATAQQFERKYGIVAREGEVNYIQANSWELYARAAKASADDLERTVADLVARVDKLEERVDALEQKVE